MPTLGESINSTLVHSHPEDRDAMILIGILQAIGQAGSLVKDYAEYRKNLNAEARALEAEGRAKKRWEREESEWAHEDRVKSDYISVLSGRKGLDEVPIDIRGEVANRVQKTPVSSEEEAKMHASIGTGKLRTLRGTIGPTSDPVLTGQAELKITGEVATNLEKVAMDIIRSNPPEEIEKKLVETFKPIVKTNPDVTRLLVSTAMIEALNRTGASTKKGVQSAWSDEAAEAMKGSSPLEYALYTAVRSDKELQKYHSERFLTEAATIANAYGNKPNAADNIMEIQAGALPAENLPPFLEQTGFIKNQPYKMDLDTGRELEGSIPLMGTGAGIGFTPTPKKYLYRNKEIESLFPDKTQIYKTEQEAKDALNKLIIENPDRFREMYLEAIKNAERTKSEELKRKMGSKIRTEVPLYEVK